MINTNPIINSKLIAIKEIDTSKDLGNNLTDNTPNIIIIQR